MSILCGKRFPKDKELVDDDMFFYTPHRVGNSILIFGKKNSRFPYQLFVSKKKFL